MKFATIRVQGKESFAFEWSASNEGWYLWEDLKSHFPHDKIVQSVSDLLSFISKSEVLLDWLRNQIQFKPQLRKITISDSHYSLPFRPLAFRDFYCFEEHVKTARSGRGLEMVPEWYQAPIFYYSNHLSFSGPFDQVLKPLGCQELDCETEIACIVGKKIFNADIKQAKDAIFGYSLLNDWSARDFQRMEMKVGMGPAKGKDFCTTFGSYIITPDEIESRRSGKGFDLEIESKINGETLTKKNWNSIHFSFEEMLVRASQNCTVYPGEVLGSGTMGSGCLLEVNLTHKTQQWLNAGDHVAMSWLPNGPKLNNEVIAS